MLNLNTNWPSVLIKKINQWWPVVKSNFEAIQSVINGHITGTTYNHSASSITNDSAELGSNLKEVIDSKRIELNAHYAGTASKHTASSITNDSAEMGSNVKEVIENNRIELNAHYTGTANKHLANSIINNSNEEGGTVEEALNTNKARFDNHITGVSGQHASDSISYSGSFVGKDTVKAALDQAKSEIDTIATNASIDPEVALARNSAVKSKTFTTLDGRLEESEQDIIGLVNNMSNYETIAGAQAKVDGALNESKTYTDQKTGEVQTALESTNNTLNTHLSETATTTTKGHVQLYDGTDSTSASMAATAASVKTAMDRANEAFTYANNGKNAVASAITAKGVTVSPADTFSVLADKIGQIYTGLKVATGTTNSRNAETFFDGIGGGQRDYYPIEVSGLDFSPRLIVGYKVSNGNPCVAVCTSAPLNSQGLISIYAGDYQGELAMPAYINYGGFKLPTSLSEINIPVYWMAAG
jgi:hypothetical protein